MGENQLPDCKCALQAFICDGERWLLFQRPGEHSWFVLGGHLKEDEDIDTGLLREIHEEIGPEVRVAIVRTIDAHTYVFPGGEHFVSIFKLVQYQGGPIVLGDDMERCRYRWFTTEEVLSGQVAISVPYQRWIVEWAVELARYLRMQQPPVLECGACGFDFT